MNRNPQQGGRRFPRNWREGPADGIFPVAPPDAGGNHLQPFRKVLKGASPSPNISAGGSCPRPPSPPRLRHRAPVLPGYCAAQRPAPAASGGRWLAWPSGDDSSGMLVGTSRSSSSIPAQPRRETGGHHRRARRLGIPHLPKGGQNQRPDGSRDHYAGGKAEQSALFPVRIQPQVYGGKGNRRRSPSTARSSIMQINPNA